MAVEQLSPDFECIVKDLRGAEGPVFTPDGAFYMVAPEVVDVDGKPAGEILFVDLENKKVRLVCAPHVDGHGGIPAGSQAVKNGDDIFVADMRLGVIRVNLSDGSFQQVARVDTEGREMQGCNDLTFDNTGDLWVTAPAGPIAPHPYKRYMQEAHGSVYCIPRASSKGSSVPIRVDTGMRFPNGIAVQHDSKGAPSKLIVAETPTRTLWSYDILGPGKLSARIAWGKLPNFDYGDGGPDGMDFDADGRLLVAHWSGSHIEVFGENGGDPEVRVKCPFKRPSNLHFRPNSNEVFVTEHDTHGLWRFTWQAKGCPQFSDI